MTAEVRRGMVRRRAGELPLEGTNLVLLSRGNNPLQLTSNSSSNANVQQTQELPLQGSPLILAHPAMSYTTFLGISLALFVCYLILPKGLRFQYCRSQRRRYAKTKGGASKEVQAWVEATTAAKKAPQKLSNVMQQRRFLVENVLQDSRDEGDLSHSPMYTPRVASPPPTTLPPSTMKPQRYSPGRRSVAFDTPTGFRSENNTSTIYGSRSGSESVNTGGDKYKRGASGQVSLGSTDTQRTANTSTCTPKSWNMSSSRDASPLEAPPSPKHPAISATPTDDIVEETMQRLKGRGIRLIAHGVQCDPKRVWIRLDQETTSVTWQTEFPRRVPTVTGDVSIVLMRGSLHKIPLPNVLYIDVGKKTTALKKRENRHVSESQCFSLLTQNGSLDLQANSLLERDSLVACFSIVLDSIHSQDWRKLYEESPPPSQAMSSSVSSASGNHIRSDLVEV